MAVEKTIVHTPKVTPITEVLCQGDWRHKESEEPRPLATTLYLSQYDQPSLLCTPCAEELLGSALEIQKILVDHGVQLVDDSHAFTQLDELRRYGM